MPPRRDDEARHELRLGTPAAARVRLTVGIPIGLLALCLVAAFALIPSGRTELTFFAAVIAGAAGVYSAYYGAANLRSQVELGKKRHALEFIQHWPTEQRARERRLLRERLKPDAMPKTELVRVIRQHDDLESAARTHLNFIQAIAIAVRREMVDEITVFEYFHLMVRDTVDLLNAYISAEQDDTGHAEIWEPVEWLDRRWQDLLS